MWEECSGLQVPKSHIPQSFWRGGRGCGGREPGRGLGGAWGCGLKGTGAKKNSLRVQVEFLIYLLLFTAKDFGNGRL